MRKWELTLPLGDDDGTPMFLRIARAITAEIRRGRLRPGDPVPSSRKLATDLEVHRNTVVAAYDELRAEGWLVAEQARGTFVARDLPEHAPRPFAPATVQATRTGFALGPLEPHDLAPWPATGVLHLAGGMPDVRTIPGAALARAYRRAVRRHGGTLLSYADPQGGLALRRALATLLCATRGLAASADDILVTRGAQQALYLTARVVVAPGDVVIVEALGYAPAWRAFRMAGAELVSVPVDAHGMKVDAIAEIAQRRRVRAIYTTPHHQLPTTATLSPGRRLQLLELARRHHIAIIEDDYDHEFHYDGRPILPLMSADPAGVVVYIGALSKVLAPGLRVGYVVAPPPLIARLAQYRRYVDRQGDTTVEAALAELYDDGEVQRHTRRVRKLYQARRDALVRALEHELPGVLRYSPPAGGMSMWVHAPGIDVDAWAQRALAAHVLVATAQRFTFDGKKRPYMRLGFSALTEPELDEAVRRLKAALSPRTPRR